MSEFQSYGATVRKAAAAASALKRDMAKLRPFLSGAFQKGFETGYLKALTEAYVEEQGDEPPVGILAEWQERAARKASGG